MVKNKNAVKGLLVLGGVGTAAFSVYTISKKYAKKLLYRHHKQEDRPSILEAKYSSKNITIKNDQDIQLRGILILKKQSLFYIHLDYKQKTCNSMFLILKNIYQKHKFY